MELVLRIYAITKTFPNDELYGLTSQMRRAAVSVVSNIALNYISPNIENELLATMDDISRMLAGLMNFAST